MSKPAARLTDMHICPLATPAVVPLPHVGGPIIGPCAPTVLIGAAPAARVTDMLFCVGPPDMIAFGSLTVIVMACRRPGSATSRCMAGPSSWAGPPS